MNRIIKKICLITTDIVLINLSFIFVWIIWYQNTSSLIPSVDSNDIYIFLSIMTVIKLFSYMIFGLYNSLWKYASVYELFGVAKASFVSNIAMFMLSGWFFHQVPRFIFVFIFFTDMAFIGVIRFGYRMLRRILHGEMNFSFKTCDRKKVLIYGAGDAGGVIIRELIKNPELNMRPVAIIDDDPAKKGHFLNGVPIAGGREMIYETISKKKPEEIIIAVSSEARREVLDACLATKLKVKVLPGISQLIDGTVSVKDLRDVRIEDLLSRSPVKLNTDAIATYLKDKIVLVTGGGGSIGSELCRQIARFLPKKLIILDNYENNAFDIQNELLYDHPELDQEVEIASIRDKKRIDGIFDKYKPQVVFHAAAHKHVPLMEKCPAEAVLNNIFGTQIVAESALAHNALRFILISTDKAVNPVSVMGATKRVAEMITQSLNGLGKTKFASVRFGNVLGSNGSVIPTFKRQIARGGPVTVTHPDMTRYFMTIPEASQLVLEAGSMANRGEVFILDMGSPVKILDLARKLITLSGYEPDKDIKIIFTDLRPGEKLHEELYLSDEKISKTINEKIFAAKLCEVDSEILKVKLVRLSEIVDNKPEDAVSYIKIIISTKHMPETAQRKEEAASG